MHDVDPGSGDVPIGELSDEPGRARGGRVTRRNVVVAGVVVALVASAAVAAAVVNDAPNSRNTRRLVTPDTRGNHKDDGASRVAVGAALTKTVATGSYDIAFSLDTKRGSSATPTTRLECVESSAPPIVYGLGRPGLPSRPPGKGRTCMVIGAQPVAVGISGTGTVNTDPTAMVTTSNIPNLGEITVRVDGDRVWENGGGGYGMTSASAGPGQPLSGFASLVMGTLGRREGAIAMNSMASPAGYLDVAQESITSAAKLGDGTVGGVTVHRYRVDIDMLRELDQPGLTVEETKTMNAAMQVLHDEGYRSTTVELSIDDLGLVRRAQTTVAFADGGTVDADVTFSHFGCSTVQLRADGPWIVPKPEGCPPPAATTASPTTVAAAVTTPATAP